MTDAQLAKNLAKFDKAYFGGALAASGLAIVAEFSSLKTSGLWTWWDDGSFTVEVEEKLRAFPWACNLVLLHEMIHMYCHLRGWHDHVNHGLSFRAEKRRLNMLGAFHPYI